MKANEQMLEDLRQSTENVHQARMDLKKANEQFIQNFISREKIFDKR